MLVFDPALISRYDKSGPRYTSYPTAVQFHAGFGEAEYRAAAAASNAKSGPLSLYFHIPFCAIGIVGDTYGQNVKTLDEYYRRLDAGELPVYRGIALNADDLLRREVITQLICHFELDMQAIAGRHAIDFPSYFATQLGELAPMASDGLITLDDRYIRVSPAGRLLIRNVCMAFDRYLRGHRAQRYSKVI